jgi:hypothetical protein
MTDDHDAYVTIGYDELNYVRCPIKGCGIIFGPADNEFEANGVALSHRSSGGVLPSRPEVPVAQS